MHKLFIISFFLLLAPVTKNFSQFNPNSYQKFLTNTSVKTSDVIQKLPEYYSYINWSTGEVVTEYCIPITYTDPNIGRNINTLTEKLKQQMLEFVFAAIKRVQFSSIFLVDDYVQHDSAIQIDLLSTLYSLSIQNPVFKDSYLKGRIVFPLYGLKSVSNPFFKNIKSVSVTNYLQKETVSSMSFDTLIIDMVMFDKFQPSLAIKILDQNNNLLHGISTVEKNILDTQGSVYFVNSITEAFKHPARGSKVAYILPENVSGVFSSDIILFNSDAQRIFSQQRTLNALRQGRVIVIVPEKK